MINAIRRFISDETGATLAEYGLLLMLIALVCIGILTTFGTTISSMYSNEASEI